MEKSLKIKVEVIQVRVLEKTNARNKKLLKKKKKKEISFSSFLTCMIQALYMLIQNASFC